MKILVVNAGSSSHKFSLYDLNDEEPKAPLWQGSIDWGMQDQLPSVEVKTHEGITFKQTLKNHDVEIGIKIVFDSLWKGSTRVIPILSSIEKIGHRVVHGGVEFTKPILINEKVKEKIRKLIPLAPLHNPANLEGIEVMERLFPAIEQIAVFDTSFHLTMPTIVKTYPLPWEWKEKGIQRFGFHGISHQYCAERAVTFLKEDPKNLKIINCHLGNGCSLCAIKEGKSYETTMGFTPMEGLMMGTRSGTIDPGIPFFLMREWGMTAEEIEHVLNFESGLKGIGGYSDMRELMNQKGELPQLAIKMFVHRLKNAIGAMAASLDGFNVLIFTAGIGENAAEIREQTCQGLGCLNVEIDLKKNQKCQPDQDISKPGSSVRVLVLHTQEDWMIARACLNKF